LIQLSLLSKSENLIFYWLKGLTSKFWCTSLLFIAKFTPFKIFWWSKRL